jgi:hypothetical protein
VLWGWWFVVTIGLARTILRARKEELTRWERASRRLNQICPSSSDTATLWCRVIAEGEAGELDPPAADELRVVPRPADVNRSRESRAGDLSPDVPAQAESRKAG